MPNLTLTLDHSLRIIQEPGYQRYISGQNLRQIGLPAAPQDNQRLFVDPITGTIMLFPLQLGLHWLNSPDQASSVIGAADLVLGPDDVANGTVFEEKAFGNTSNSYIYHAPVFLSNTPAALPPVPGVAPSVVGAPVGSSYGPGLTTIERETEIPFQTFAGVGTPVGNIQDGRVIAYTKERQPANAPFYFRWSHPNPKSGHQTRYLFYVGQLILEVRGNQVILHRDVSRGGDRSSFTRIWGAPMFSNRDYSAPDAPAFALGSDAESDAHDRSLLVIPYFRNRVLLRASNGTVASVRVREPNKVAPQAVLTGPAADRYTYEITRSDVVAVWVLSYSPGRFQIQKVRYAAGQAQMLLPPVTTDYSPVTTPTVTTVHDSDHGTAVNRTVSDPVDYAFPINDLSRCPAPTNLPATAQTRTYGVRLTLVGESTHRWTPFFYGLSFLAPTSFKDSFTTPVSVVDTGVGAAQVEEAFLVWGERPGDGGLEARLIDESPYPLDDFYHRVSVPVNLKRDLTSVFTGWTDRIDVEPLHSGAPRPRKILLTAVDRWKQLADHRLRDQRDWTGTGHITVVLSVAQQAGVETTSAETPLLTAANNTPLGGLTQRLEAEARLINPGWQPKENQTAAEFILRIAGEFSGWDVGFRADGTFFYLPKDFFTTTSLRFFHSKAEATAASLPNNPLVRSPVTHETLEPEANVVQAIAADNQTGKVLRSSLFVDWASILNKDSVNFLPRHKWLVFELPGTYSCQEINRVARVVFDQVRRRRRRISFVGDFVPTLKLNQIIEVGTYGLYRVKSVKADLIRANWHEATYTCEAHERGYNPP